MLRTLFDAGHVSLGNDSYALNQVVRRRDSYCQLNMSIECFVFEISILQNPEVAWRLDGLQFVVSCLQHGLVDLQKPHRTYSVPRLPKQIHTAPHSSPLSVPTRL